MTISNEPPNFPDPGPFVLSYVATLKEFNIISKSTGLSIATPHTTYPAVTASRADKNASPEALWRQVATWRERANARLLVKSREMYDVLLRVVQMNEGSMDDEALAQMREILKYIKTDKGMKS